MPDDSLTQPFKTLLQSVFDEATFAAATKSEADGDHPASHYLVVEDPAKTTTWHMRVRDADGSVNHTLLGAAWAALHGGYRGNKYEGPQKQQALSKLKALYKSEGMSLPSANMSAEAGPTGPRGATGPIGWPNTVTADFDLEEEPAGRPADTVIRNGILFRCGNYPDKDFSFDQDDLKRAIESFQPVPLDLEHRPTVLEGKLGHVARIFPGDDGASLMGEVHLPAWLDAVLDAGERKVSATWDRATKRLLGLALVRNPRVSDAALMAAFSMTDPQPPTTTPTRRSTRMNPLDWMKKKAQEEGVELDDIEATFGAKVPPEVQAAIEAERAENARLKAQVEVHTAAFAKAEAGRRQADAATFAREAVTAGRVLPASLDALAALTAHIAATDSVATFAEGEKSGAALLAEFVESLPNLTTMLTTEQVPSGAAALFNATTTPGANGKEEITDEKLAELAALTPLGRAGLQARKA